MKRTNTLDIQNLLGDLEKDVIEAMAAERSAWVYDEYLANGELHEESVAEHEARLNKLNDLLKLLKWYHHDTLIAFRRPAPRRQDDVPSDNAAEAGGA